MSLPRWAAVVIAASACLGAAPVRPVVTAETLMQAVGKLDRNALSRSDCDLELAQAETANTANLLYGSMVCLTVGQQVDGAFLLLAGQLRFMVDSAAMPPDLPPTGSEPKAQGQLHPAARLYGILFFQAGGLGPDEVYIDSGSANELLAKLDGWTPKFSKEHDPGWTVTRTDPEAFAPVLASAKARRRGQAVTFARQMSDPAYLALHREFIELQKRNPKGFVVGTPDHARSLDVRGQMDRLHSPGAL